MPSTSWTTPIAVLLLAGALVGSAHGQESVEPLFAEDFESGNVCPWSSTSGALEPCLDCSNQPDGTQCLATRIDSCPGCDYTSACDEFAPRNCPCTTYTCSAGTCQAASSSCPMDCFRNTDGTGCGAQGCGPGQVVPLCCNDGQCSACGVCGPLVAAAVDELRFEPAWCEKPAEGDQLFASSGRIARLP